MTRGVKPTLRTSDAALTKAPRVPAWLSKFAKAEWKRVAPVLTERKVLTEGDLGTLESDCAATGLVRACEIEIARDGVTIQTAKGRVKHPAITTQNAAMTTARLYANELGLTPVSRSRPAIRTDDMDPAGDDLGL